MIGKGDREGEWEARRPDSNLSFDTKTVFIRISYALNADSKLV